jgi:peptidoglycan-associated lipoprotein
MHPKIFTAILMVCALPTASASYTPPVFYVFFDTRSANLSKQAMEVLDFLADGYRRESASQGIRVSISGHADRVGSRPYNQTLGCRRARAVEEYLIVRGIPPSSSILRSDGEDRPLVDTADEVSEPQNRNVTLEFQPAQLPTRIILHGEAGDEDVTPDRRSNC